MVVANVDDRAVGGTEAGAAIGQADGQQSSGPDVMVEAVEPVRSGSAAVLRSSARRIPATQR